MESHLCIDIVVLSLLVGDCHVHFVKIINLVRETVGGVGGLGYMHLPSPLP